MGLAGTPKRRIIYEYVRSGMLIAGCFSLRTSMNGRLILVYVSPGNNIPLLPCSCITLTAVWILQLTTFELKVLAFVS